MSAPYYNPRNMEQTVSMFALIRSDMSKLRIKRRVLEHLGKSSKCEICKDFEINRDAEMVGRTHHAQYKQASMCFDHYHMYGLGIGGDIGKVIA